VKRKKGAAPSVKAKALQWLSQREHSRIELRGKLLRWMQREAAAAAAAESAAATESAGAAATAAMRRSFSGHPDEGAPSAPLHRHAAFALNGTDDRSAGVTDGRTVCDAREAAAAWREQSAARVDALLDELEAARYLSDTRFIESRIHARQARFGNRRIEQELREHGLQAAAHDKALLRETETARARQVLRQRFAEEPPQGLSPADRQRRTRFLASRGFSFEAIQAALRLPDD
jgi:regulatory protein